MGRALHRYGPAGIAAGCYDLFSLNGITLDNLPSHRVSVILPFCESDTNTKLLVKKGVHVSIAKQVWLVVGDAGHSLPAKTIVSYVALLLEW